MEHEEYSSSAKLTRLEDDLILQSYFEGAVETKDLAVENWELMNRLAKSEKYYVIVDLRQIKEVQISARQFWGSDQAASTVYAAALVVRSGISRAIGNFFIGLSKPKMQTKLVESIEDGKKYIDSCR
jgi:hypothetical protein